jgi:uncharacterized RDD family membrane protein YckC
MAEGRPGEVLSIETPESVAFAYELAGLGSRGIALMLDMLLIFALILAEVLVVGAVALVFFYVTRRNLIVIAGPWVLAALIIAVFVTYWGYFIYGEVTRGGRTAGKRAMGIRVVRDDGSRVGFTDSLIRTVMRLVDGLPGSYAVGIASVLLTRDQKRLGDLVAGTVVVRDAGELTLLSDGGRDAERVSLAREFLRRRGEMTPAARYQVGVAVLATFGEEPGEWDEPTVAGRLVMLAGWESGPVTAEGGDRGA